MIEFGENGAVITPGQPDKNGEPAKSHGYENGPRSLLGRYRWFRFVFWIYIVLMPVSWLVMLPLLGGFDVAFLPIDSIWFDTVFWVIGISYMVSFLLCVIASCSITYRAMRNLWTERPDSVSHSPAWSVGSYFVPFVNLVVPVMAMNEIYTQSHEAVGEARPVMSPVSWWWACWIIGGLAERLSGVIEGHFAFLWILPAVSALLFVVAAVLLLMIFSKITRLQERMIRGDVSDIFS